MISQAFSLAVDCAIKRGAVSIKDLPGCFEFSVGEWDIAINGHGETMQALDPPAAVPPYSVFAVHKVTCVVLCCDARGGDALGGAEDRLIADLERDLEATALAEKGGDQ